ncbi:MAG: hypothetical protein QOH41_255 [Blastocatellia bacterium]|jgi:hypothetical protein|nr:hypothetical protein [Blastocatellia bacterium]
MSSGNSEPQKPENLFTAYRELCTSYRAIDDFRTKLLGFLPLATGTGIFFLVTDKAKIESVQPYFRSMGAFGFVITLGLFFYEWYGIKKCTHLIWAGRKLEIQMKVKAGQFTSRPDGVAGFINEPLAAGVIYPAVLAAWTFIALALSPSRVPAGCCATFVFVVGFGVLFFYNRELKLEGERRFPSGPSAQEGVATERE